MIIICVTITICFISFFMFMCCCNSDSLSNLEQCVKYITEAKVRKEELHLEAIKHEIELEKLKLQSKNEKT